MLEANKQPPTRPQGSLPTRGPWDEVGQQNAKEPALTIATAIALFFSQEARLVVSITSRDYLSCS